MVRARLVILLKKIESIDKLTIQRICIDDFAIRKRQSYGTVMIDWDTHKIIDMIPSRESAEVSKWLSTYPNLKMISRDGASCYSSAIRTAHPNVMQVTDRFHLLKNLSEAIDLYIKNSFPARIEIESENTQSEEMNCLYNTSNRSQRIKFAKAKRKEGLTIQEIAYLLHSGSKTVSQYLSIPDDQIPEDKSIVRERQHQEAIKRKTEEINHVRQLFDEGMNIADIAKNTHHSPATVKRYLNPNYSPINGHYDLKRTGKLSKYEQEIIDMRSKGKTYKEIYEIIKKNGYDGTVAAIRVFMQKECAHAKHYNTKKGKLYVQRISLTRLVYRKLEDVKLITKNQKDAILKTYPELAGLYELIKEFHRIVFSKKAEELDNWIENAKSFSGIPGIISFAEGIIQDKGAVKNAILYDYNNGLAEGSVNKIKLTKRIMYGRNSFEMLKTKILMHELLRANSN